jgi:hypothetical protein
MLLINNSSISVDLQTIPTIGIGGKFGPNSEIAVIKFQDKNGVGGYSCRAMGTAMSIG